MNNVFDIKRFWNYALLNYACHKRQYLGLIVVAVAIQLLNFFSWKVTFMSTTWEGATLPYNRVLENFMSGFYMAGILFMWGYIRTSMQGMNGQSFTMQDLLLPVSTFERYLFVLINSTVVAIGVYLLLFQLTSSCVSPMYLLSDHGYAFKGFFGYNEAIVLNQGYDQVCHIGVADIFEKIDFGNAPTAVKWNIIGVVYTSLLSLFMWGEITFQHRGAAVLTLLLHGALFGSVLALFIYSNHDNYYPTGALVVSYSVDEMIDLERVCTYLLYASYILPITYQWVVWKKFKNRVVTK